MRIALHRFYEIGRRVLLFWAAGLLALASLHAHAATTYTFPGNLPAGCTGSNGNYSCTSLSLNYQDAIVIAAPKPATITVKSNFSTNQNKINAGGAASDLTFIVKGALDLNWNSTLNANVTASTVQTDNSVIFGGNINATGDIVLGDSVHVPGSITSSAGQIQLGNNDTVDGNVTGALDVVIKYQGNVAGSVTSSSSQVRLENNVTVNGNVTAVKDVTIKFQGHVVGSVTSTSKQVQLENEAVVGSITTGSDGAVDVKYSAVVCGDITTRAGSITLEQNNTVGGNVKSSSGDITLGYQVHVRGSVSTGGKISRDSSSTVNDSGLSMPAVCSASPSGGAPSGFNAVDIGANAVTGVIKTKIAGQTFNLDVVALTDSKTVKTDFEGTVALELVDSSDGKACAAHARIGSIGSVKFANTDHGRVKTVFTEDNAWQNVQVRMTYTPFIGSPVVACSTDAFAIRPSYFDVQVTHADPESAGTTENLNNVSIPGGTVHKAGRPFTIIVTAKNAKGNTTTNYAGSPSAAITQYLLPASCAACTLSSNFSGSGGTVVSSATTYNEVGAFKLQLQDGQFASIDAADGSTPDERTITSSEISVGRFVPDHFTLVDSSVVTPACTAVAPGFTYMDQPFGGFSFTLEARNKDGNRTANYHATGTNNLANGTVSLLAENNDAGKNLSGRLASIPATSWVSGAFIVDTGAVTFNRAAVPDGPYDALQFGVKVNDPDGVVLEGLNMNADTAGSCIAANTCDGKQIGGPTQVRFGRLRLTNAYGSPRLNLPIPMRAEYYNGTTFVTNTLDSCTTISRSNIAMPAYRGGVSSANMTVTQNVTAGSTFAAGIGRLTLARPNPAATRKGSVDVCVDLGTDVPVTPARCVAATPVALPWLKGRWTGNGYDDDPVSRATFGIYKKSLGRGAEMIYFREMY